MSINTDVWGAPETWVTSSISYAALANIKNAATDKNTYRKNYNSSSIPLNTLDLSPAFYGIGKGSVFCNPYYIAPYANNGDLSDPQIDVKPICNEIKTRPLIFTSSQISGANNQYDVRYAPDVTAVVTSNQSNAIITTSFNYQKVFAVPFVWYAASNYHNNTSTVYYWGLYEYFSTFDEDTTPPYILGFGYRLYLGDAGSRTLGDAALLPYTIYDDVKGYEGSYNNVPFYARYGMKYPNFCCYATDSNRRARSNLYKDQRVVRNATVGTADTGFRYKYCKSETTAVAWYFYDPDNPLWKVMIEETASGNTYWNPIPYIEVTAENKNDVYEYLLKQIAYLGLPFLYEDTISNYNPALGSEHYALPVFDEDGITTGEFKTGDEALLLPNSLWVDARNSGYDPNKKPDNNNDRGDLFNIGASRQPSLFSELKFYAMNSLEYYAFITELNRYYIGKTPEDWALDFQGVNPSEYILGCYYTYFDLPKSDTTSNVEIGRITLPNTTALKLTEGDTMQRAGKWEYCSFGTREISPFYYNFRDYSPYTEIELYLPLAGTIELETNYVMGHSISITYYYSLLTMSGVACVYRDNLLYKTADLQIASQIPLLSTNIGQYQNQIIQLENARKQNAIRLTAGALSTAAGIGATIATGGAALPALLATGAGLTTIATGALKQDEIDYQINHTSPSVSVTGASEHSNNLCTGQLKPKLIIKRADQLPHNDKIYSKTVGNACCINSIIKNMTGLIVCSNVDTTGIPATCDEINAIKQALTSGVYV